jgi:CRP/FNR family cyclic AMP-dependent transcriptional regulator
MEIWDGLGRPRTFQQGQHLWEQDDPAGIGAFLVEGILGVEKVNSRGDRVVFTELKAGAILGEMSCLDGHPHSATVKALTESTIRIFTDKELKRFLRDDTERFRQLLVRQNERLRHLTNKLLRVGTEPVQRRLAYWLIEHGHRPIAVTHQELAAQLATTRESVSKALGRFRREGLVSSKRGQIAVKDRLGMARLLESFD